MPLLSNFIDDFMESLAYPFPGDSFFFSNLLKRHWLMPVRRVIVLAGADSKAFYEQFSFLMGNLS